jgi:hypothetical protein
MKEHDMGCTFDDEHKVEDLLVGMLMHGRDFLLKELILNCDLNPNEGPIYQDHMDEFTTSTQIYYVQRGSCSNERLLIVHLFLGCKLRPVFESTHQ